MQIVKCQVNNLEIPTKLLVVNGWSDNHKGPTEVLNLVHPDESCQLPDFPEDLIWSVGGYTENGALICSGRDSHTPHSLNTIYRSIDKQTNQGCKCTNVQT